MTETKKLSLREQFLPNLNVKIIAEGGISVALAIVLSLMTKFIPFLNMPDGGHVSLSTLPIIIFALRNGPVYGFVVGLLYAVVNFLSDGMLTSVASIFLDYLVPFSLIGLIAGFFVPVMDKYPQSKWVVVMPAVVAFICNLQRFFWHTLSGVVAWGTTWGGSAVYNITYMAPVIVLTCIFVALLQKVLVFRATRAI